MDLFSRTTKHELPVASQFLYLVCVVELSQSEVGVTAVFLAKRPVMLVHTCLAAGMAQICAVPAA